MNLEVDDGSTPVRRTSRARKVNTRFVGADIDEEYIKLVGRITASNYSDTKVEKDKKSSTEGLLAHNEYEEIISNADEVLREHHLGSKYVTVNVDKNDVNVANINCSDTSENNTNSNEDNQYINVSLKTVTLKKGKKVKGSKTIPNLTPTGEFRPSVIVQYRSSTESEASDASHGSEKKRKLPSILEEHESVKRRCDDYDVESRLAEVFNMKPVHNLDYSNDKISDFSLNREMESCASDSHVHSDTPMKSTGISAITTTKVEQNPSKIFDSTKNEMNLGLPGKTLKILSLKIPANLKSSNQSFNNQTSLSNLKSLELKLVKKDSGATVQTLPNSSPKVSSKSSIGAALTPKSHKNSKKKVSPESSNIFSSDGEDDIPLTKLMSKKALKKSKLLIKDGIKKKCMSLKKAAAKNKVHLNKVSLPEIKFMHKKVKKSDISESKLVSKDIANQDDLPLQLLRDAIAKVKKVKVTNSEESSSITETVKAPNKVKKTKSFLKHKFKSDKNLKLNKEPGFKKKKTSMGVPKFEASKIHKKKPMKFKMNFPVMNKMPSNYNDLTNIVISVGESEGNYACVAVDKSKVTPNFDSPIIPLSAEPQKKYTYVEECIVPGINQGLVLESDFPDPVNLSFSKKNKISKKFRDSLSKQDTKRTEKVDKVTKKKESLNESSNLLTNLRFQSDSKPSTGKSEAIDANPSELSPENIVKPNVDYQVLQSLNINSSDKEQKPSEISERHSVKEKVLEKHKNDTSTLVDYKEKKKRREDGFGPEESKEDKSESKSKYQIKNESKSEEKLSVDKSRKEKQKEKDIDLNKSDKNSIKKGITDNLHGKDKSSNSEGRSQKETLRNLVKSSKNLENDKQKKGIDKAIKVEEISEPKKHRSHSSERKTSSSKKSSNDEKVLIASISASKLSGDKSVLKSSKSSRSEGKRERSLSRDKKKEKKYHRDSKDHCGSILDTKQEIEESKNLLKNKENSSKDIPVKKRDIDIKVEDQVKSNDLKRECMDEKSKVFSTADMKHPFELSIMFDEKEYTTKKKSRHHSRHRSKEEQSSPIKSESSSTLEIEKVLNEGKITITKLESKCESSRNTSSSSDIRSKSHHYDHKSSRHRYESSPRSKTDRDKYRDRSKYREHREVRNKGAAFDCKTESAETSDHNSSLKLKGDSPICGKSSDVIEPLLSSDGVGACSSFKQEASLEPNVTIPMSTLDLIKLEDPSKNQNAGPGAKPQLMAKDVGLVICKPEVIVDEVYLPKLKSEMPAIKDEIKEENTDAISKDNFKRRKLESSNERNMSLASVEREGNFSFKKGHDAAQISVPKLNEEIMSLEEDNKHINNSLDIKIINIKLDASVENNVEKDKKYDGNRQLLHGFDKGNVNISKPNIGVIVRDSEERMEGKVCNESAKYLDSNMENIVSAKNEESVFENIKSLPIIQDSEFGLTVMQFDSKCINSKIDESMNLINKQTSEDGSNLQSLVVVPSSLLSSHITKLTAKENDIVSFKSNIDMINKNDGIVSEEVNEKSDLKEVQSSKISLSLDDSTSTDQLKIESDKLKKTAEQIMEKKEEQQRSRYLQEVIPSCEGKQVNARIVTIEKTHESSKSSSKNSHIMSCSTEPDSAKRLLQPKLSKKPLISMEDYIHRSVFNIKSRDDNSNILKSSTEPEQYDKLLVISDKTIENDSASVYLKKSSTSIYTEVNSGDLVLENIQKLGERSTPKSENKLNDVIDMDPLIKEGSCGLDVKFNSLNKDTDEVPDIISASGDNDRVVQVKPKFNENLKDSDVPKFRKQIHIKFKHSNESDSSPSVCKPWFGDEAEEVIQPNNLIPAEIIAKGDNTNLEINIPDDIKKDKIFESPKDLEVCSKLTGKDVAPGNLQISTEIKSTNIDKVVTSRPQKKPIISMQDYLCKSVFPSSGKPDRELHQRTLKVNKKKLEKELKKKKSDEAKLLVESHSPLTQIPLGLSTIPLPGEEFKIENKVTGLLEKTKEEDNAPFMDFLSAIPEVSSEHIKVKVEILGSFKENSSILANLENKENLSPIGLESRIESIPDFECQNLNASCEPEVKDFDRNSPNQDIIYEVAIEKSEFSEKTKKTELTPEEKQEIEKRNIKIVEERMKAYEHLAENLYLVGKVKSQSYKGDRRMICDCTLSKEEIENNETGCGEDCLNKLLMIECGSRCTLNDRCMNKNFQHKNYANVEVFNAEEKGCGVRACTYIMPGTFIMEYVGEVFDTREFKRRRKEYGKSSSAHFYFMALNQDRFIDATLKGNISRFINHSCSPNAETQKWTVNGDLRIGFFTTKTIAAGEEINFDYRLERYGREPQKCYCGTPECRGWLGESPDEKTKEEKEEDRRKELRNKKRKELRSYFGDVDLEYEIEKLNLTGLRNRQDTLNLSRLMVRALEPDTRMRLLKMLETGEEACKRLFLDYHGLKLLWSWMADISSSSSSKNIPLKLEILKTLGSLPIINKTQLTESKVMDIVERWSKDINKSESSDDKEKIEESKKVLSSTSEKNELSEDSDTDTPDSKDPSPSDTTSPDDSSLDSSETPINSFSNQVILSASSQVSSDNNLDDDNSSSSSPPDADSATELSVADIALKLLPAWNNLNEAFKIPRKERLQMMKEHEREVDQEFKKYLTKNKKSDEDRTQAFYDRWRYGVDKDKDKSRKREKSDKKKKAKRDKDDDDKNLSKEERRERFAMQVAQEDEAARQKKLQESMWALHLRRCLFLGQDPNYTPIFDPTGQFYWDPNSAAWQPYLGPVGSGTLPVPASYGGNPSLMENICLNAASMNQVFTSGAFYPLPITPVSESECAMQTQRSLPVASLDGLNIPLPEELMPQDSPSMGETLLAGEDAVSCGKGVNDSTLPSSDILSVTIVLPYKWKMASDEMGNLYFYHTKTRYSQWDIPTPDLHQRLMNQYSLTSDSESDSDSDSESSSNSEDFSSDDDEAEKEVQEEVLVQTSPAGDEKMIKRVKGQRKHSEKLVQERVISPILFEDREAARKERKEAKEKAREEARMERWSSYKSSKNGSKDSVESGLTNDVGESGNDNDDDSLFDISMPFGKSSRKYKQISDFRQNVRGKSKERMVTALADNSEAARKVKESFKTGMANFIVSVLNPYRRSDCIQGRIHNTEDFKYLARKLTHFVMVKELKQLPSVEELECSESVKHKTKEFVKKYLSKYGSTFHRDPNDTKDYLAL